MMELLSSKLEIEVNKKARVTAAAGEADCIGGGWGKGKAQHSQGSLVCAAADNGASVAVAVVEAAPAIHLRRAWIGFLLNQVGKPLQ
jgi:hypothetical protein